MTYLSVNINKIATLRNARGENNPDVTQVALDCERFGAHGIIPVPTNATSAVLMFSTCARSSAPNSTLKAIPRLTSSSWCFRLAPHR